jgi:hypothetical protein
MCRQLRLTIFWTEVISFIQRVTHAVLEREPFGKENVIFFLGERGLEGAASTFTSDKLILNGTGEFAVSGPEGDNGLSGKKLVVDHYGPGVPIERGDDELLIGNNARVLPWAHALRRWTHF